MAGRVVTTKQIALARARERRRALDAARDAQDQRVEEATAAALVTLDERGIAERALETATSRVADALRTLLAEDVTVERAAALLDLDVAEIRRLSKIQRAITADDAASNRRAAQAAVADEDLLDSRRAGSGAQPERALLSPGDMTYVSGPPGLSSTTIREDAD